MKIPPIVNPIIFKKNNKIIIPKTIKTNIKKEPAKNER